MSDGVDIVVTLHALATYAESANHWTDDKRMMDASGVADTLCEAMDHIEELEERLKAATDDAKEAEAYAEELEAKLAKAMETLDTIRTASEFHSQAGISDCVMRYAHECTCRLSDATLAELAGGKDEDEI